jgi:N-acyl homoserine lactone hydrolase
MVERSARILRAWKGCGVGSPPTITPVLVAELLVEGERMPVYVHVIDHPDGRVLVDTHLHFDHCGGNHLFSGRPIYVQRRELDDARSQDDYTIREWVDAPGVQYVPVDGACEMLPGLRLVPAPGHTRGSQVVVVETGGEPVVIAGDTAVFFAELDEPRTEGQRLVRALDPSEVWLSHAHEPWRPHRDQQA